MMELATSMIRSGDSGCFGAIRPDWLADVLGTEPSSISYLHRVLRPSLQRSLGECTDQSTNGRHKSTVGTPSPDPALLVARLIPTPRTRRHRTTRSLPKRLFPRSSINSADLPRRFAGRSRGWNRDQTVDSSSRSCRSNANHSRPKSSYRSATGCPEHSGNGFASSAPTGRSGRRELNASVLTVVATPVAPRRRRPTARGTSTRTKRPSNGERRRGADVAVEPETGATPRQRSYSSRTSTRRCSPITLDRAMCNVGLGSSNRSRSIPRRW
jgi:hypothetical protein